MPIRRARVMVRLLEVLYRTEYVPALDEVETLLSLDVCNAELFELVFELIFIQEPRNGC